MFIVLGIAIYIVVALGVALLFGRAVSVADREHDREASERGLDAPGAAEGMLVR